MGFNNEGDDCAVFSMRGSCGSKLDLKTFAGVTEGMV